MARLAVCPPLGRRSTIVQSVRGVPPRLRMVRPTGGEGIKWEGQSQAESLYKGFLARPGHEKRGKSLLDCRAKEIFNFSWSEYESGHSLKPPECLQDRAA